ncbi:FUSC family protein [Halobacillus sp. KGW1]|uniref:FUSC family protein n=1 Tax=Halobacillus sp. KGW1 TaxID=1793726 RepID=UPI0007859C97|nr:FUSC family protein [Halobacillus sp. KGW1]
MVEAKLRVKYWFRRLLASDPGRKRLSQAGKATISLISSVFTTIFLMNMFGHSPLLPAVVSGMAGMMGIMVVMDDTRRKKQVTTGLLAISASSGITLGSLLSFNAVLVAILMIIIIFSSFYFSQYGSRYFSLGMIAFFTTYLSSFLKLPPAQFPWFYLAVVIGISYAFFYNFYLFKDSAQLLRRSIQSFHRQANLTFEMMIEIIEEPDMTEAKKRKAEYNVKKLRQYASNVSTDINEEDVRKLWQGLKPSQLRLYIFDTAMFVMTLSDSLKRLKEDGALEMDELRSLLVRVIHSLKQAKILDTGSEDENLKEARNVVLALRSLIDDLFEERTGPPEGWLYLVRRIDAIASHVTEGAQKVRNDIADNSSEEVIEETEKEEDTGTKEMKPTTKKAIQSMIAGTIAIIAGYLISPIQPYWIVLTAFIVLLGTETVGRTYLKGLERSVGTVIGAVIGFLLANLVSGHIVLIIALLFSVVFFAFYLLTVSYTLMSVFITMLIAFMYDLLLGGISYQLLGARVLDTIIGAAIALAVSAFILPSRTMDKITEVFTGYLENLETYVTSYVKGFRTPVQVKNLANTAFDMDDKIQAMEDEAKPILQGPGARKYSRLPRLITVFTAINYYAKHLVASSYQKNFQYPEELCRTFEEMERKLSYNMELVQTLIETNKIAGEFYDLKQEREEIERHAPNHNENQGDLVHHLYYVWKINQALMLMGDVLGANEGNQEMKPRTD